MPDFRIRASGEIVSDLQRAFPHISIPQPVSANDLEALGVDPILEGPQPVPTRFQSLVRGGPTQDGGLWFWGYSVVDWDAEVIAAETERQWATVRTERNKKLYESDWTQLADAPVDDIAWAVYRQALRDVTTQSNPFNIIWPVPPE
jgi:hypothetical protein